MVNVTRLRDETEVAFAGLNGQLTMLRSREVSSRELVELSLARIEASQPVVNAFRVVRADAALAEARDADRRLAARDSAPLLGVPVAVKDDMDVVGEPTAFGCVGSFAPKRADSESVRRLKAAGAVIVGKTNTPEIGQLPVTGGAAFGVTRNPWSLEHTPGGSSGGASAAVAAALVPAAVGSDGLGSVRIPAAWCNLIGIKPQRGRVSMWPHVDSFGGLNVIGPLARMVVDAALLLDAVAGHHPAERSGPPPPAEPFAATAQRADPGRPLRIALSFKAPYSGGPSALHDEVRTLVQRFATLVAQAGHVVEPADPFYGPLGIEVVAAASAGLGPWIRAVPDTSKLDPRTRDNALLAVLVGSPLRPLARALRGPLIRRVGAIFDSFDVLLTPTTAAPPLPAGAMDGLSRRQTDHVMAATCPYAWPWNVVGWPAMSVPAGFTNDGLPVGAQLLAPEGRESLLIALAAQLEQTARWHERRAPDGAMRP